MQLPENILALIEKYHAGTATPQDKLLLNEWYYSFDDSKSELTINENLTGEELGNRIENRLMKTLRDEDSKTLAGTRRGWKMPAIAAAVAALFFIGTYLIFSSKYAKHETVKADIAKGQLRNDIAPGGNKATLTLADGSSIALDTAFNGTISRQGNINIQKVNNGQIAYNMNGNLVVQNDRIFFNTITTPRGGQYHVTLSDGTQVWLNAASSIRFPVVFTGKERTVDIKGEAYFEVAKNKAMPFKVRAASSEVEVLGTHFNINAYDDEPSMKTTLLEGKVKISVPALSAKQLPTYLEPTQQAGINKEGKIIVTNNADMEEAVAWMHGNFQFKSADLKTILRQIARWYDVDVEYKKMIDLHFTGQLTRNGNVSAVFKALALTGEVHFTIDGKKIIVSP